MINFNAITPLLAATLLAAACSAPYKEGTLRELDVVNKTEKTTKVFIKPKTTSEIKAAYMEYLQHVSTNNKTRMTAISRLAEIEFDLNDKILESKKSNSSETFNDIKYKAGVNKTISLLTTTLRDYPKEKTNDRIMYQLSKAYEQNGEILKSIAILKKLSKKYPKSSYYIESQFRIGEAAFSRGDFITAEDAYTEVISSKKNELYFEKSTFKRAWSRFKQNYYIESVDDIVSAINFHGFNEYENLDQSEKSQFNEYYRLLGLSFAYAGGIKPLRRYIKTNNDKKSHYLIYLSVSNIYLEQERYSDAVSILEDHIKNNNRSINIPYAQLKIIEIWRKGGFSEKANRSINQFYTEYNPESPYWKNKNTDKSRMKQINIALKTNILQMSGYYHKKYQIDKKDSTFNLANLWYKRYLKHYKTHIHKDNINYLYAELLSSANKIEMALSYYEKSAYDNKLILNKNSAYATIISTNKLVALFKNNKTKRDIYLNKHIKYSTLFSQLYPNDKRTGNIISHASELAFTNNNYTQAIQLTRLIPETSNHEIIKKSKIIAAHSYFKLNKFNNAEMLYASILKNTPSNSKNFVTIRNNLALSVYKQGEVAKEHNDIINATHHFSRISVFAPRSDIAATGLYDAIAIYISNKIWGKAIISMKKFQDLYPDHKFINNITKNLSVAYLKSNQGLKAAQEFEKLSDVDDDNEIKKTALLQAAELYEEKGNLSSAIRSYIKYSKTYKKPFSQYMETMYKLSMLNKKINEPSKVTFWQKQIINADKHTISSSKTERTKFIASTVYLSRARERNIQYRHLKLVHPLKKNLIKKKQAMQAAIRLYGQASYYKLSEATTESTYAIAAIYNDFSQALLNSAPPSGLNANEKEQYKILIEDRAFPFEEKSIEFHELNMSQSKENTFNKWVGMSLTSLKSLFPARYNRSFKIDEYINVLH